MDQILKKMEHYTFLHEKCKASRKIKAKDSSKPVEILDRPMVSPLCNQSVNPALIDEISKQKFYLSTAINYTNGLPHVGHAYEAITSDIIVRYHRIYGRDTFFLTGTDEHGQKVENSALKQNKTPQEIADFYADKFKLLDKKLHISFDKFIRTTDKVHERNCEILWNRVFDKGDIYLKDYVGWYDVHSERYITDFEAEKSDYKDEHGRPYEKKSEESYFFKMSKYQDQLLKHIEENPCFIQPDTRKNEIQSFLKEPLHDLCISRTVCQWGVKCPPDANYKGDKKHVMYVWFDALTNYLSGIEYLTDSSGELAKYWPVNVHIIGKDIIRFHCVIWPCMLLAADIPLPISVFGHGFVNDKDGVKMSKSLGNVVDPWKMIEKYGVDAFRLYLAHETSYGADLAFNEEAMLGLFNSFLSSGYGNLVHRSTSLCQSISDGKVPDVEPFKLESKLPFDLDHLRQQFESCFSVEGHFKIHAAVESLIIAVNSSNAFLQNSAPWHLKGNDPDTVTKKKAIVRSSLEAVYMLAHFIYPFCPGRISNVFERLGVKRTEISKLNANFNNLPPGTTTYVGLPLYATILTEAEKKSASVKSKPSKKQQNKKVCNLKLTELEELFYKIDIRVGKIVDVWHHETADGLFCEKVDVGEKEPRLIASGLRKHYKKEDLQDRKILAICNLKAANLKGFKSHGMVLCASIGEGDSEKVEFCDPPADSAPGERVTIALESGEAFTTDDLPAPSAPNAVSKKKIFKKMAEYLRTNSNREATFNGIPLRTSKGVCRPETLVNAILR